MSDEDEDEDDEDERPARKKQRSTEGGGKHCVCGPLGCMRKVNEEGFRLPKPLTKRLEWLHCWYPPDAVPEAYMEPGRHHHRVHPCHFRPEDIEVRDRKGGSGTCQRGSCVAFSALTRALVHV